MFFVGFGESLSLSPGSFVSSCPYSGIVCGGWWAWGGGGQPAGRCGAAIAVDGLGDGF